MPITLKRWITALNPTPTVSKPFVVVERINEWHPAKCSLNMSGR